jgi:hypothetical protein
MALSDLLFLIAPYLFLAAGILMLFTASYTAGTERLNCSWKRGRLNCIVERFRFMGMYSEERKYAINVTDVFIRTSTTSNTYITPAKNKVTTTTASDTLILRTKGGEDIDTIGGEKAREVADRVDALLKNHDAGPVTVIDSNWPFSFALGGFGMVFVLFGGFAAYATSKGM